IAHCASGGTVREFAEKTGCSLETARDWHGTPEFKSRLSAILAERLHVITSALLEASRGAVRCLDETVTTDNPSRKQVSAADILLTQAAKYVGLSDIEKRLAEIERWRSEQQQIQGSES